MPKLVLILAMPCLAFTANDSDRTANGGNDPDKGSDPNGRTLNGWIDYEGSYGQPWNGWYERE